LSLLSCCLLALVAEWFIGVVFSPMPYTHTPIFRVVQREVPRLRVSVRRNRKSEQRVAFAECTLDVRADFGFKRTGRPQYSAVRWATAEMKGKKRRFIFKRRTHWERRHVGVAGGGAGELVCGRVVDKSTREV